MQGVHLFVSATNISGGRKEFAMGQGDFVKISLADEGIGIPEKFLDRIFDPYFSTKVRDIAGEILELLGYEVVEVADGGKAVDAYRLARVIVACGYSNDPVMTAYKEYGFQGRLAKPFQLQDLQQENARVLQRQ